MRYTQKQITEYTRIMNELAKRKINFSDARKQVVALNVPTLLSNLELYTNILKNKLAFAIPHHFKVSGKWVEAQIDYMLNNGYDRQTNAYKNYIIAIKEELEDSNNNSVRKVLQNRKEL